MADPPSEGRKARTRIVKAPASNVQSPADGPTILDAEAFTHGGVPKGLKLHLSSCFHLRPFSLNEADKTIGRPQKSPDIQNTYCLLRID